MMAWFKTWTYRAVVVVGLTTILMVAFHKKAPVIVGSRARRASGGAGILTSTNNTQSAESLLRNNQLDSTNRTGIAHKKIVQDKVSVLTQGLPISQGRSSPGLSFTIPRIIHQQWDSHLIPRKFARYVKSWVKRHPSWTYVFWTPWDVLSFLRVYAPDRGLRQYQQESTILMKDDIMRFYILEYFGGVYVDLDMECLLPLDNYIKQHACFITENAHEHSILLDKKERVTMLITIAGCRPGHPFFRQAQTMLDRYQGLTFGEKHFFTDMVYQEYNKTQMKREAADRIVAAEAGLFLPLVDPGQLSWIRKICRENEELSVIQRETCEDLAGRNFRNQPRSYSYAVHYWEHFVFWDKARKAQDVVSIYDVIPEAQNATQFMLNFKSGVK